LLLETFPDEKDRLMFFGNPAVNDAIVVMASSFAFAPLFAPKQSAIPDTRGTTATQLVGQWIPAQKWIVIARDSAWTGSLPILRVAAAFEGRAGLFF
jgi:hypothetical protein